MTDHATLSQRYVIVVNLQEEVGTEGLQGAERSYYFYWNFIL
jgi:hypothetical protein